MEEKKEMLSEELETKTLSEEELHGENLTDKAKMLSPGMTVLKRFFRSKLSMIGLVTLIILFVFSFLGPVFSPWYQDGKEVAVTPELLDMAFSYASAHKLYTSSTTVDLIIQAIINGKIANLDEMVDEKKAMVSNAYSLLSEVTNLDEFFKGVDNIYARK